MNRRNALKALGVAVLLPKSSEAQIEKPFFYIEVNGKRFCYEQKDVFPRADYKYLDNQEGYYFIYNQHPDHYEMEITLCGRKFTEPIYNFLRNTFYEQIICNDKVYVIHSYMTTLSYGTSRIVFKLTEKLSVDN